MRACCLGWRNLLSPCLMKMGLSVSEWPEPDDDSLMSAITVLIPTHNRCAELKQTLEAMYRVDRHGIACEFVVIDNNCTDSTPQVLAEYKQRLPLISLQEKRPGKNCALNKALRECSMRDIVVFADDDVSPNENWLQEIVAATKKWPNIAVFGGRIHVKWPNDHQPDWAASGWIMEIGYSLHDLGNDDMLYSSRACPFGPNYWVRKTVFDCLPFFDETIGPRPENRIMGSETSFLLALKRLGFQMLYYPGARVLHRILTKECSVPRLRRRGYWYGRGEVKLHGWHRRGVCARSKVLWLLMLLADYIFTSARYAFGLAHRSVRRNCEITVQSMVRFGCLYQTFKEFGESLKSSQTSAPMKDPNRGPTNIPET